MLIMLQGRKQVRLFGCRLPPLYPNPLGSKGRTVQASVDCDNPDLESHPLFAEAICHHAVLQPGDMYVIVCYILQYKCFNIFKSHIHVAQGHRTSL